MEYLKANGINLVSLVFIIAFCYPIFIGIVFKSRSRSMMDTLKSMLISVALICSMLSTFGVVKELIIQDKYGFMGMISSALSFPINHLITKSKFFLGLTHVIVFLIIFNLLKVLISFLNRIILRPISNTLDSKLKESNGAIRALLGGIFQLPKAVCYVLILTALLSYSELFIKNDNLTKLLENSKIYNYVNNNVITPIRESEVAKRFPNLIEDSFKIVDENNNYLSSEDNYVQGVVFYNGVTLDEGVSSSEAINSTAIKVASEFSNNYDKGKAIYKWIGNNISYDDEKAIEVMQNQFPRNIASGAISAFTTRSGVCFDYACLYVAMCRANNIPVRLIVGEGYNGNTWVSHSWNEVYINSEGRWVPVDCTFYSAGNYYDNYDFNREHRNSKIAGEWE